MLQYLMIISVTKYDIVFIYLFFALFKKNNLVLKQLFLEIIEIEY